MNNSEFNIYHFNFGKFNAIPVRMKCQVNLAKLLPSNLDSAFARNSTYLYNMENLKLKKKLIQCMKCMNWCAYVTLLIFLINLPN